MFHRGLTSALGILGVPLGTWWCGSFQDLVTDERWNQGYVVVLPGIEGRSWVNLAIARGLADGGVSQAIEVVDWTPGSFWRSIQNVFRYERNRLEAAKIAQRIVDYQTRFPGRPVYVVGHSGGGAMAVFVAEALPANHTIESVFLLANALSPTYDLRPALHKIKQGIWNFSSTGDLRTLRIGTRVFGTIDRVKTAAAGAMGFRIPPEFNEEDRVLYEQKLHEIPYNRRMVRSWHLGGHLGCTNRVFVADWLAPKIVGAATKA